MSSYIPTNFAGGIFNYNSKSITLDQVESRFINESGDIMKGDLNMNGNKLRNIPDPKLGGDAVNKKYVDSISNMIEGISMKVNKVKNDINDVISKNLKELEDRIMKNVQFCIQDKINRIFRN